MSKISKNIRILRGLKSLSQEQLADELDVPRSRIGSYEEGRAEPPVSLLVQLSDFFHISIDALVRADLSKTDPSALFKIGMNRTLFPVMIDKKNNDLIEVVQVKAMAGYLNGYADPEYIEELPTMNLPFKWQGKHRAFTIKGDSMPPLKDGSIVIGSFVETLKEIQEGHTYIVLTKEEGVVYKRLYRNKKSNTCFELHSDNKIYQPYKVKAADILEIWKYVCCIHTGEFVNKELDVDQLYQFLKNYTAAKH